MDFLKKVAAETTGNNTTTAAENKSSGEHPEPSQAEILSSAKVVADAAKATFQKDQSKVDNTKVAGGAADILDAAEKYGKLDKSTGIGSYVEKAENYLHQYESSHSTTTAKPPPATKETHHEPAPATEEAAKPEGGLSGYMKMAEGLLNKDGSESKSGR